MEAVIWTDKSVTWKSDDGKILTTGQFPTIEEAKEFCEKLGSTPIKSINVKGIR